MNLKELKELNFTILSPYVSTGLNSVIDMIIHYQESGKKLWKLSAYKTPTGFTISAQYEEKTKENENE